MIWANPYYFLLIIPIILLWFFYMRRKFGREGSLRYSHLALVKEAGGRPSRFRRITLSALRAACLTLMIVALARPQSGVENEEVTKHVVDCMIAMDLSSSMGTLDFEPQNRIIAAKIEARRFIEGRPYDRIGLVAFASQSITQCPLTIDHQALLELLNRLDIGLIEDGTAIGLGLASSVNRLKESNAKSKIVILLTDGVNNAGAIDPITAAGLAKAFGVRVYTIGVGREGRFLLPIDDPRFGKRLVPVETEIDEAILQKVADITGGKYFRAQDERTLNQIFAEIDKLEKTEIRVRQFTNYKDLFERPLYFAFLLLALEIFLASTLLNKVP